MSLHNTENQWKIIRVDNPWNVVYIYHKQLSKQGNLSIHITMCTNLCTDVNYIECVSLTNKLLCFQYNYKNLPPLSFLSKILEFVLYERIFES